MVRLDATYRQESDREHHRSEAAWIRGYSKEAGTVSQNLRRSRPYPEQVTGDSFRAWLTRAKTAGILSLVIINEAHTILYEESYSRPKLSKSP